MELAAKAATPGRREKYRRAGEKASSEAGFRKSDFQRALKQLDKVSRSPDPARTFVDVLPLLLDTFPEFKAHLWEFMAVTRAVLDAEENVARFAGEPARIIADLAADNVVRAGARRRVLDVEMLEAPTVAATLGSRSVNPSQYANNRRKKGDIVGVPVQHRYLFPAFQFDADRKTVIDAVLKVNHLLGAAEDPWGVASWWVAGNDRLDGARPMDEVPARPNDVLSAARSVVAPLG